MIIERSSGLRVVGVPPPMKIVSTSAFGNVSAAALISLHRAAAYAVLSARLGSLHERKSQYSHLRTQNGICIYNPSGFFTGYHLPSGRNPYAPMHINAPVMSFLTYLSSLSLARSHAMTCTACRKSPPCIKRSISSAVRSLVLRNSMSSRCCSDTFRQFLARYM